VEGQSGNWTRVRRRCQCWWWLTFGGRPRCPPTTRPLVGLVDVQSVAGRVGVEDGTNVFEVAIADLIRERHLQLAAVVVVE